MAEPAWQDIPSPDGGGPYEAIVYFQDPFGNYRARVKMDGCIDFEQFANTPVTHRAEGEEDECDDYIHICDLEGFIARLQALHAAAAQHFANKYGKWPAY